MRRSHFAAFAPVCPVCLSRGRQPNPLCVSAVFAEANDDIDAGIILCPDCLHEFPILDGIPILAPDPRTVIAQRGLDLLVRDDLPPALESLIGDAIGPDTWLDASRATISTYAWDGWADLDPEEAPPADALVPLPGASRRCLARLLALADPVQADGDAGPAHFIEFGCGAGRTTFDLARQTPGALVLGMDLHLGLLRLARRAGFGEVHYARRRVGIVYDRRRFAVSLPEAERVDFWACDALMPPFSGAVATRVVALNLLDAVANPSHLLHRLKDATRPRGHILLATPYDWATRATPVEAWLGGHSQRTPHLGAAEAWLDHRPDGLDVIGEVAAWPWQTRLHDRSHVAYRCHLIALRRTETT